MKTKLLLAGGAVLFVGVFFYGVGALDYVIPLCLVGVVVAGFLEQWNETPGWHERLGVIGAWILIVLLILSMLSGSGDAYLE
jgi:hypothetical protein